MRFYAKIALHMFSEYRKFELLASLYLPLPLHFARIRPVEMTVAVRDTFEKLAYGLCVIVKDLENAMPSPIEKQ